MHCITESQTLEKNQQGKEHQDQSQVSGVSVEGPRKFTGVKESALNICQAQNVLSSFAKVAIKWEYCMSFTFLVFALLLEDSGTAASE